MTFEYQVDNNLICVDHLTTVNAYYMRDVNNNTNNNNTILEHLTKLGYLNQNENTQVDLNMLLNKIRNELLNNWDSNIRNRTINDLLCDITNQRNNLINIRITRMNELQPFVDDKSDTYDFYNHLTLEELSYLGY